MVLETEPGPPDRSYAIDDARFSAPALPSALYVVATPIGHLRDVTLRALETLAAADIVACEDTRVTTKLLRRYGIQARMRAYDDHASPRDREALLHTVEAGGSVALVSDAGTPLVSDPGYRLVAEARARALAVVPIPGASALLAGLSAAGLPTDRFAFEGFLPPKREARRARIDTLDRFAGTVVLYEAPQRLVACLADLIDRLGADRDAAIARELTKSFEEVRRGSLQSLWTHYETHPPKGEIVILLAPRPQEQPSAGDLDAALRDALATLRVRDAAHEVADLLGVPKKLAYARALVLKGEKT